MTSSTDPLNSAPNPISQAFDSDGRRVLAKPGLRRVVSLRKTPSTLAPKQSSTRKPELRTPAPLTKRDKTISLVQRKRIVAHSNIPEPRPHLIHEKPHTKACIRVLVAAANQTTARALSSSLSCNDMIVVGTATTSSELETALHLRSDIDVLVTDVLISGVQTSLIYAPIVAQRPELNVLCYTFRSEPAYVMTAIRCGALGYVLRNTSEDLANCVRLIKGGGSPMSPAITRHVLRAMQLKKREEHPTRTPDIPDLSDRELEILELLAKGISFSDIATILIISPHTVTAHIKKIYRKLQVHSRGEAVYEARAMNLISDS